MAHGETKMWISLTDRVGVFVPYSIVFMCLSCDIMCYHVDEIDT